MAQSLVELGPALKDKHVVSVRRHSKPPAFGYRRLRRRLLKKNKRG